MGFRFFLFSSFAMLFSAMSAKAEPIDYTPMLLSMISSSRTYIHLIPAVATKGCNDEDLKVTKDFVSSRERLSEQGLIARHELIHAYMLLTEAYACRGQYDKEKYCSTQQTYLARLKAIYAGSGQPVVSNVPLPGHYLHNIISLRTRCS